MSEWLIVVSASLVLFLVNYAFPWSLEAAKFFWMLTRTIRVTSPDPACPLCGGESAYLQGGLVVDCAYGCNETRPRKVIHWGLRLAVEKLGIRLGMDKAAAHKFSSEFEELANSYLGPPIPAFVRTNRGWEYRHEGAGRTAIPLR